MKHIQSLIRYRSLSCIQLIQKQAFSSTSCVFGRKTRNPYDMRETMKLLGTDVGPRRPGGTKKMAREIGLRGSFFKYAV